MATFEPSHRRPLLLLVVAFFTLLSAAQLGWGDTRHENAEIYNKANESYASKDYQAALKLYLELIERGVKNSDLYYNLGNAYYKSEKLGYSILYFEKALELNPFDRDTRENLEYTKRSLKERIRPLYSERIFTFFRSLYSYIKPGTVAFVELFFFSLFIGVALLYLFIPFARSRTKKQLLTCSVLLLLSAVCLFWYSGYEKSHPRGVIVEKEVSVLGAPISESEPLFTLLEGTQMRLIETRGDWMRISIADGREGWILAQTMLFI